MIESNPTPNIPVHLSQSYDLQPFGEPGANSGYIFSPRYYAKEYAHFEQAQCELLANILYQQMGVPVLPGAITTIEGRRYYCTPFVSTPYRTRLSPDGHAEYVDQAGDAHPFTWQHNAMLSRLFVPVCFLADWDAVSTGHKPLSNLLVVDAEHLVLLDHGGALLWRGSNGRKALHTLTPDVSELATMRDPYGVNPISACVFGHVTETDIRAGIERLCRVLDETSIGAAVKTVGFDEQTEQYLIVLLSQRLTYLRSVLTS